MGESNSLAYDFSSNGRNGTISGAVPSASEYKLGGKSIVF